MVDIIDEEGSKGRGYGREAEQCSTAKWSVVLHHTTVSWRLNPVLKSVYETPVLGCRDRAFLHVYC
jgi:hypothetical protein